ncbi:MAG: tyrosine-type recombinase/integrase [Clostridia bacterium]|nr:tyrosine-type recombinase/integrase [Clostridia bacterium]
MATKTYFSQRDVNNNAKINEILDEFLPEYCQEYILGISDTTTTLTRLGYVRDLKLFFHFLTTNISRFKDKTSKDITLADVENLSPFEIEKYMHFLTSYQKATPSGQLTKTVIETNAERARSRKLSALRSMIKYFIKKNVINVDPTRSVNSPKIREKEIVRLDVDEVKKMFDTVDNGAGLSKHQLAYQENTKVRDLAIVGLLLGTGIRVSELVGIDMDDVDFDNLSFVVTRKGGARVILYFSEEVAGMLYDYFHLRKNNKRAETNALFLSLQNKRITTRAVENLIKKYSPIAAPLKKISPHKLRSTYGTQLYKSTRDIYVVADVLGHKDVNTTKKHYAAVTDDIRRKASTAVKLRDDD